MDRVGQRHENDGCKWCKEWKKAEQMVSVAVQTDVSPAMCREFVVEERGTLLDKQCETEFSSTSTEHPIIQSSCS